MRTILVARPESASTSQRVNLLAAAGYNVITCPGPWPHTRCGRHSVGYCPLTEGADLMLYDPALESQDANGQRFKLAVDSGRAHPEVPLVLESDDPHYSPAALEEICLAVPGAEVAQSEPQALLAQIHRLLQERAPGQAIGGATARSR